MNLIVSGFYPMILKLMTSRPHGGVDGSSFEFSNKKVGLVTYHLKGRFKTIFLIEAVLSCDDYYRVGQKSYPVTLTFKVSLNEEKR